MQFSRRARQGAAALPLHCILNLPQPPSGEQVDPLNAGSGPRAESLFYRPEGPFSKVTDSK